MSDDNKGCFGCVGVIILIAVCSEFGFPGFVSMAVLCAIVGIVKYSINKSKQRQLEDDKLQKEYEEKKSQQRKAYAAEFKTKIGDAIKQCESNLNNSKKNTLMPTYESIDKQKEVWSTLGEILLKVEKLEIALKENEFKAKCEIGLEEKLIEYKNELNNLKITAQESIARLEAKEKEICEQVIDCMVVAGEHKYALENLLSEAKKITSNKDEISKGEKETGEEKLNIINKESELEYMELQAAFSSHPKFIEYSNLVSEQQSIVKDIKINMHDLVDKKEIADEWD